METLERSRAFVEAARIKLSHHQYLAHQVTQSEHHHFLNLDTVALILVRRKINTYFAFRIQNVAFKNVAFHLDINRM